MGRAIFVCIVLATACAAQAATATLTPDKDNTLFQSATGNISDGAGEAFYVGRSQQSDTSVQIRRALIHFNLSSIPTGATVTSASLRLVDENRSANGDRTASLRRLLQDWGQGTSVSSGSGSNATTNDATWVYRFYNPANPTASPKWTTAGGSFSTTSSAATTISNFGGPFTFSASGMVSDIQSWLSDPTNNFGWEIIGDESTSSTAKKIYSREYSSSSNRPQLTITYNVPEPTNLLLFAAATTLAIFRRK